MTEKDNTPPERGWLYRRLYSFLWNAVSLGVVAFAVWKMDGDDALKMICFALLITVVVRDGLYLGGASVLDYAKLASAWRGGKQADDRETTT